MKTNKRIKSIDLLRGLVMVIMALDHTRDFFHYDAFFFEPGDITQSNPALFATRFITHFCAPVFVFLAGTSAFFVGQRRTKKELSIWLLKRGFWLIFVEVVIMKFGWLFKLDFSTLSLQVIWALGICMIFLAGFIHVPKKLMIALSLIAIFGHNLLDTYSPESSFGAGFWNFLHNRGFVDLGFMNLNFVYPVIPWAFMMYLGYYFGELYKPEALPTLRKKRLLQLGIGITLVFFTLRFINVYGDMNPWSSQENLSLTIMSFFNLTKYPPSLLYLLVTIGPSILFLGLTEKWRGTWTNKLVTIGRVPMFFYIIHVYIIHIFAMFAAKFTGFKFSDMIFDRFVVLQPELKGYGFELWVVYLIWIAIIFLLYPICKWYDGYKSNNRDKWWLSYL
jgi:uncharacterized membrane protein